MKFFDFFAGIGGFRLGMEMAGHECVGHCEIDKYAHASYVAMHRPKESEVYFGDIRTVDPWDIPECDIYCGGFPCQAFSIAGRRRGFEDTRGTLFFEIMRIARERKPRLIFLENVKGLLNHEGGDTFETIITTMAELGYGVEWQVLNSKHFGVPQNRERVFIVGHLGGIRGGQVFPITEGPQPADGLQGHSYDPEVVANTLGTRIEAQSRGTYPTSGGGIVKVNGYHLRGQTALYGGFKDGIKKVPCFNVVEARYYKGVCNQGINLVEEDEDNTSSKSLR